GLFQSTDGGNTWNHLTNGLPALGDVQSLAFDPSVPGVVYVAVYRSMPPRGVFKSTDHGASWTAINDGLTYPFVAALVVDPLNPTTLYAGALGSGMFKSTDGGGHWANAGLLDTVDESFVNAL